MRVQKSAFEAIIPKRKYEKLLNEINVNPVTIEDDAEINEMENLLKRARRIAEEKYFK